MPEACEDIFEKCHGREKLGNLRTLSINKERISNIDMEEVVDQFAELSNRRIILH